MSGKGFFVTGTDTGCGKTEITLGLMRLFQDQGLQVLGLKPVAAGAEESGEGLRNKDALRIQDAGSLAVPYELINPYCFEPPIAPQIAAAEVRKAIRPEVIRNCFQALTELADLVVVEGVGGWHVPLGEELDTSDLPVLLHIPAILVVGLRLGCLSHALLSAEAIMDKGCGLAGWVANRLDPAMLRPEANLATLEGRIPAPRLGSVEHLPGRPDPQRIAAQLDSDAVRKLARD
jgi:dethiobiotin synthetase